MNVLLIPTVYEFAVSQINKQILKKNYPNYYFSFEDF